MYIKRMQWHFKVFVKPITTSHFESFHFKCVTRPDLSGDPFSQLCNQKQYPLWICMSEFRYCCCYDFTVLVKIFSLCQSVCSAALIHRY